MATQGVTIRRATLDDLEELRGLWRECRLPDYELEKRFTEFQLAVDENGWIMGALGLRFSGQHGEIHHAGFRRADLEATLTDALWERVLALAHQHGAYRLWVREHGDVWAAKGFHEPAVHERRDLPAAFGQPSDAWRTLKIREEPLKVIAVEEQLDAYLELERLKTDRLLRRGQFFKILATAFAAMIFLFALVALMLILRRRPGGTSRP